MMMMMMSREMKLLMFDGDVQILEEKICVNNGQAHNTNAVLD